MPWKMKDYRKVLHILCVRDLILQIQVLMEVTKRKKLVDPIWGPEVHPSNVIITIKQDMVMGNSYFQCFGGPAVPAVVG